MMTKKETQFIATVWDYYKKEGRHALPWRTTDTPYKILLSEIMLQQTQVDRVLPKYKAFLKQYPTVQKLSQASLGEVLLHWQGLGYNRRAKMLHTCAKEVVATYKGKFPQTYTELVALPGIGPYTAGAVLAFAFNTPQPILETNIRAVYLYHFFNDATDVSEKELQTLAAKTLDTQNPREWYWALMDYGSYIKKEFGNPNSRAKAYVQQSKFEGSDRQIRGAIVRLCTQGVMTRAQLHAELTAFSDLRIDAQIEKLLEEGMLEKTKRGYQLPS